MDINFVILLTLKFINCLFFGTAFVTLLRFAETVEKRVHVCWKVLDLL
jgi:hypothetical protein